MKKPMTKSAANTARKFFELKKIDPQVFENMYLGMTVPQIQSFYGGPWTAAMLGGERITAPVVNQACITGIVCTKMAALDAARRALLPLDELSAHSTWRNNRLVAPAA